MIVRLKRVTQTTTTETLLSGGTHILGCQYAPAAVIVDPTLTAPTEQNTGRMVAKARKPVTESCVVTLMGTPGEILAEKNEIAAYFADSEDRELSGLGDHVYVEVQMAPEQSTFRARIMTGRVEWKTGKVATRLSGGVVEIVIVWMRAGFWEGPEQQIPLTNSNGSNNTSGLTIYNHDDADSGHDNYVEIAAANVGGDYPAPCRIEITNTFASATRHNNFYLGHNFRSDPANFTHSLEAENATGGTTNTPSASSSNNAYKSFSLSGSGENQVCYWSLSTAFLNACRGNAFMVLAHTSSVPFYSDLQIQMRILFANLTTIWKSAYVTLNTNYPLQELGVIQQLPPYLIESGDVYPHELYLYIQKPSGGSYNFNLDYLQLWPLDGYRKFNPKGYGLGANVTLKDDGMSGELYTEGWATPGKTGHYVGNGPPILLRPNRTQRLYVLHDTNTGGAAIDRTSSLKVFYRERRANL